MVLEVCVDSYSSLLTARDAGANRIELCSALNLGGLTPSYGLMKQASEIKDLEIFVMIRPRSGDFLYSDLEFETMKHDIEIVKKLGFDGIVTGILKENGRIDLDRTKELVELAHPLGVVFHRAIDRANNPIDEVDKLIEMGIVRILTSGQEKTALKGARYIKTLQEKFGDRITIMPGSGVNYKNIEELYKKTKCTNFHLSGRININSRMVYQDSLSVESENILEVADYNLIKQAREVLDNL